MQRIRTIVVSVTMCSCFVDNRIVGMSASEGAESSGSSTTTSAGQTPEMSATETSATETSTTRDEHDEPDEHGWRYVVDE
jgi:hypothetical protein